MVVLTPRSGLQLTIDVVMVSYMAVFALVGLSHCAAMWQLRKEFFIALRSPMLAVFSGVTGVLVPGGAIISQSLDYSTEDGAEMFLFIPLILCFTTAYVMRGLRLLVMYDRHRRLKWGSFLRESKFFKVLLAFFLVLEVVVWSLVPAYGVPRVANMMPIVGTFDMLLTLLSSAFLYRKMKAINDLFNTSKELMTVGFFAILSLVIAVAMAVNEDSVDPALYRVILFMFMINRFHTAVWITNIEPVRDVLRQSTDRKDVHVPWFPYVPWGGGASSKVAVGVDGNKNVSATTAPPSKSQAAGLGRLEPIMNSPPLVEAFDSFCQKALCGESIMFLREVAAFRDSMYAVGADEDAQLRELLRIVDKFVKSGSSYEVNIDSRARTEVMRYCQEASFKGLDAGDKADIFTPAETQTSNMLADNLLTKFQATETYQRINEGLLAIASGEEKRVPGETASKSMSPRGGTSRQLLKATFRNLEV